RYRIVYPRSVMGLGEGALVYLDGMRVGAVTSIDVAGDDLGKVVVSIAVDVGTPIRADTHATLQYAGITGLKVIDLVGGSYAAPALPPGGTIAAGESAFDRFETQAETLADQSARLMERANRIVDNLVAITDPHRFAALDDIVAEAHVTTGNLAAASAELRATLGENRVALRQSLAAVRDAAGATRDVLDGQVAQLATGANDLIVQLRALIDTNQGPLRAAVLDLRQASRSFKELAHEVRQRPSR